MIRPPGRKLCNGYLLIFFIFVSLVLPQHHEKKYPVEVYGDSLRRVLIKNNCPTASLRTDDEKSVEDFFDYRTKNDLEEEEHDPNVQSDRGDIPSVSTLDDGKAENF